MNASAYIPDGSELEEKIKRKAQHFHDGKVSSYVRRCIEKDLAGTLDISSKAPLAEIARVFNPSRQLFFSEEMGAYDQPLVIMRFLEALLEAIRRGGDFEPEAPFALYNSTEQLVAFLRQSSNKSKFDLIQGAVDELLAAEDPAEYGAAPESQTIKNLKKHATPSAHKPTPTPPKQKPTARD